MGKTATVQYVTDDRGKRQSVILPVQTYEAMLEDIGDLVAVAERQKEKSISNDEMKKRLRKSGLL